MLLDVVKYIESKETHAEEQRKEEKVAKRVH